MWIVKRMTNCPRFRKVRKEITMEKRYTLPVAIAMVVGTVIGSGIFFKAENVLKGTGGNIGIGILAFIIMGVVMIISACTFGIVAQSHEGVDGLVGFAKASCGKTYSYYVGWFMAVVYYPSLVGVLCWLPARYFGVLIGWEDPTSGPVMTLAVFFMVVTYLMNALAPKIAGKFQISTTIIKLIPLLLMAVVGTIVGLADGQISYNFANVVDPSVAPLTGLFGGVVSLSFAFEGWICATSIGSELKDSKKNLPRALLIGTVIVAVGLCGLLYRPFRRDRQRHHDGRRSGWRQTGVYQYLRPGGRRSDLRLCLCFLLGHLQRPDDGCYPRHV